MDLKIAQNIQLDNIALRVCIFKLHFIDIAI